jgi:DNA-binding MarR family transcriptional regulator
MNLIESIRQGESKRLITPDYGRLRTITDDLERLDPDEMRILTHLLDYAQITRTEATEVLEQGKSKAHLVLRRLVAKGLITRRGQGRGTCYMLAQKPQGS